MTRLLSCRTDVQTDAQTHRMTVALLKFGVARYLNKILQTLKYRVAQKNVNFLENPTKIEEIQGKNLLTEIEPLQLAF